MDAGKMPELMGLQAEEAERRLSRHGLNKLTGKKRKSLAASFLESFGDPMIKILLIALAVNVIFLFKDNNWFESVGIAVAILLATLVSTLSEYGSESAFERLREEASRVNCRVRRDGVLSEVPVTHIVTGDVVQLQSGDRIPADGVLLAGRLDVDQSSLNGESKEKEKLPNRLAGGSFDDDTALFSGSVVCGGEGYMLVTTTGDETVYGRIGTEIQSEKRVSPLKHRLSGLAGKIGVLGYIAALITVLAYFFNVLVIDTNFDTQSMLAVLTDSSAMFRHLLKAATLAVTVVVMAVPEGLPMMITVVLSSNMKRMFRDNVLVRKLVGIETAGSMNILFTDKTGTLTRGQLLVTSFIAGNGKAFTRKEAEGLPAPLKSVLHDSLYFNNSSSLKNNRAFGGNATCRAALEFAACLGKPVPGRDVLSILPFSSSAKYMAASVKNNQQTVTYIKGAPEKILPFCTGYYDYNGYIIPTLNTSELQNRIQEMTGQAFRVIALAVSEVPVLPGVGFRNLKLVGLLGIRDEIRREAVHGVKTIQNAGIQVVMITGDARDTAVAIAHETGIMSGKGDELCLTSAELAAMSDEALAEALPSLRVVARALPQDKSRLVRAAQGLSLVAGMTGDGVNDSPALKQADIGFAMGSGAEVAKEAGDIVILDDNIQSIAKAISYGRTIFKSIRKFIIYQLSTCMCAVGVTVAGPLMGIDMPITVIQMLWINMVMDTLAGIAFSGEKARAKYMTEPPKPRGEPIINPYMFAQIAVTSIYTTTLCLFFLKSPLMAGITGTGIHRMTAFFALFMFCAIFNSFCARTHRLSLLDYLAANKPFLWIMGLVTVVQICIIYLGGPIFRTVGMDIEKLAVIMALAFTIIPVDFLRKIIMRRFSGGAEFMGT